MNLFDPRTFSTDWEILVVDKLNRCINSERLLGFSGLLRSELDLPIQVDWNSIEFALGINSSFEQIWNRILSVTDRATQLMREFDLDLFPSGSHPVEPMFNSSHIHVGTIHDEAGGVRLENRLMRYTPVFAALAANSPTTSGMRGDFKSYRVRRQAHGAVRPNESRDPGTSQPGWGNDATPKIYGAPTMEIRIPDGASSRRLLAEFATFIAAYVHYQGTKSEDYQPTPDEYREYLSNRWVAARFGMQATFMWNGRPKPVTELIDEMLDECQEELGVLGVKRSELGIINIMITKRICQADLLIGLMERYPDQFCLASVYGKLVRQWDVFDEYVQSADALDPVLPLNDEAVIAEHFAFVGEGTYFYRMRDVMFYPQTITEEIIEQMIERKLIRREITPESGILLHRIV